MSGAAWLAVGVAGFAGSVSRLFLTRLVALQHTTAFPWGTLLVNLAGCLLMGALLAFPVRWAWLTSDLRLALTAGFCGSFTTFSAFSVEGLWLLRSGAWGLYLLYVGVSLAAGLLLTAVGMWSVGYFFK